MTTKTITHKTGKTCVTICSDATSNPRRFDVDRWCLSRVPVDGGVVAVPKNCS